ncbi:MAG: outer membrane protein assembly factor BamD [Acidobacteriota bacterium]|nr:MAG: outer membrane protein assembly factor BamD [Acidobacteriota bacterium]
MADDLQKPLPFRFLLPATILVILPVLVFQGCAGKKAKAAASPYAKYQKFSNQELYERALHAMKRKHPMQARNFLDALLIRPMDSVYTPLARLRIGDSHYIQGGFTGFMEAIFHYRKFLRRYPRHEKAAYAQYQIGMCHFRRILSPQRDARDTEFALLEFQKVVRLYPESVHAASAKHRIRLCHRKLAEREFAIGKFYYRQVEYEAALDRFKGILQNYEEYFEETEFFYYLGETLWALGQREEGRKYLEMTIHRDPKSSHAKMARERLAGKPNRQSFWKRVLPPYL